MLASDHHCVCAAVGLLACLLASAQGAKAPHLEGEKPHIVLVLADDYGWANFGVHNVGTSPEELQLAAETNTPNLNRLAKEGLLLDRHYAFRLCSPSRSSLMSGRLPVHVNWVNTGITDVNPRDPVSGSAGIPRNMTGLAAVMKKGEYTTHMVGKWDAGALTPEHTPFGRGFDTFFGFFQHANDYWQKGIGFTSTGEVDVCGDKFIDFAMLNSTYRGVVTPEIAAEMGCFMDTKHDPLRPVSLQPSINSTGCVDSSYCLAESCYEEAMLQRRAVSLIQQHDPKDPLFLFFSTHLVHTPLQVPASYLERVAELVKQRGGQPIDTENRWLYAAMVLYLDETVAAVEQALREKGMWENTLMIFTSDNGGPVYEPGSANNYPLKGGKYTDWEGGIRTNAFVSGGFVPKERRGSTFEGVVSIADWYGTFAELAGVSFADEQAAKANEWLATQGLPLLHPVDSVPQWKHIVGDSNGRPEAWHISNKAVLKYPYKLVTGTQVYSISVGPLHPNCSTIAGIAKRGPAVPLLDDVKLFGEKLKLPLPQERVDSLMDIQDCGAGCLLNVETDPEETTDLAADPAHGQVLQELQAELRSFNQVLFDPDRGQASMDACYQAMKHGGMYGPFVDAESFYTPFTPTPEQERQNLQIAKDLDFIKTLLPDQQKALDWFTKNVLGGSIEPLFEGESYDKCLSANSYAESKRTPELETINV